MDRSQKKKKKERKEKRKEKKTAFLTFVADIHAHSDHIWTPILVSRHWINCGQNHLTGLATQGNKKSTIPGPPKSLASIMTDSWYNIGIQPVAARRVGILEAR